MDTYGVISSSTRRRGDVASDRAIQPGAAPGRSISDITVSFRLLRQPKVRVGHRYALGPLYIEIESLDLVPFSSVSPAEVRRAGEADRDSLRQRAAHAGPIGEDTLLYRVEFHVVGPDGHNR
jgi:hypothetical protein